MRSHAETKAATDQGAVMKFYYLFCRKCRMYAGDPYPNRSSTVHAKSKQDAWDHGLQDAAKEHDLTFHGDDEEFPDVEVKILKVQPIAKRSPR
jgi:hypothetical protein